MVLSLFSRKSRIVNIIISDHSIRYLELKQVNPPLPLKWGERLLPHGLINNGKINDVDTLSMILDECIEEWKIRNRKIRFLIPESFVIIRNVHIPEEVKDDEIKSYLYLELGTSIHLPFDEPVFDAVVLSAENKKKEVLVFAAPEENVLEYTELFSSVKLSPLEAEISPLALYRLYYHLNQANKNENMLIVQFDLKSVNICIFEGEIPFFMHHLPIEFVADHWEMKVNDRGNVQINYIGEQQELGYQFEDIYKEISRLMDFYRYSLHQGKKQVSKILLNGDHPLLTRITTDMKERFDVPLETILYDGLTKQEEPLPQPFYLSLGLALKGV